MNMYRYCMNNPVMKTDPTGTMFLIGSCIDPSCSDDWEPDWKGYDKCMKKAKKRLEFSLELGEALRDTLLVNCTDLFKWGMKQCKKLPFGLKRIACQTAARAVKSTCKAKAWSYWAAWNTGSYLDYIAHAGACRAYISPPGTPVGPNF